MSNTRFLIKYASRQRPIWFIKAIHNITNTIHTKSYQILVSADLDDPTMMHEDVKRELAYFPHVKIVYGKSDSKIHACNRDLEQADPFDILINMSDDMAFRVVGWDKIIEQRKKEVCPHSTDCFLHFNDGYVGDKLPTMAIMGYDYFKRDGYIYYPEYKSFSCDAEQMYVAMARQKWHYFPEILFTHEHPANNLSIKNDELYRINSLATDHDVQLYWKRLHQNFGLDGLNSTPWDIHKKQI